MTNKRLKDHPLTDTEIQIIRCKYGQPKVKIRDLALAHKRPAYLISYIISNKKTAAEINKPRAEKKAGYTPLLRPE